MTAISSIDPNLQQKIKKQVEFYFGDSNLPRDKFLQAEIAKDKEGWVSLPTILSFNRMKALTTDKSLVLEALKESGLIEISKDGNMIRRISEIKNSNPLERTLFVSGLKKESSLEDLEKYFEESCSGLASIRMLRTREDHSFTGNVFIEFGSIDDMTSSLQKLKAIEGLNVMTKSDYFALKGDRKSRNEEEEYNIEYSRGCLIRVEGVTESLDHHQVKEAFAEIDSPIAYFQKIEEEPTCAWIRFKEPKGFDIVKLDHVKVGDTSLINMRLATEDEEQSYYKKLTEHMKDKRKRENARGGKKNQKHSKIGDKGVGRNFEKKRHASLSESQDEPASKTARLEDSDNEEESC